MTRPIITTSYTGRIYPWYNCMAIIQTGFWDDTQVWEDSKIWWDAWLAWTWFTARTTITTNYT